MLWSWPNILTMSRIVAIPLLMALLYLPFPGHRWLALAVYIIACVTDYFDGYLARRQGQVSPFGRFLDPIADKLLVAALLLVLVDLGEIAGWTILPALIILCREILVSGLREYLAEIQVPMPVSHLAKWKTTIQMIALGILVVGAAGPTFLPMVLLGDIGLWLAAAPTLVTGYDYLRRGLRHMGLPEESSGS